MNHNPQNKNSQRKPVAKSTEARKKFERQVDAMSGKVTRFRVDAQRFFVGDLPLPPEELRESIRTELRELQNSRLATSADGFRLTSLEAQFNSHSELFGRRMREREEGAGMRRKVNSPEPSHDTTRGVVFSQEGSVEALYKGLFLSKKDPKPAMDLDRFRNHLQKQAVAIQAKTGAADIQFRIAEENGKMKIKAKPIKK